MSEQGQVLTRENSFGSKETKIKIVFRARHKMSNEVSLSSVGFFLVQNWNWCGSGDWLLLIDLAFCQKDCFSEGWFLKVSKKVGVSERIEGFIYSAWIRGFVMKLFTSKAKSNWNKIFYFIPIWTLFTQTKFSQTIKVLNYKTVRIINNDLDFWK